MLVTYSGVSRDVQGHSQSCPWAHPVLFWLSPPGHCPVWSAGFQSGSLFAELDSGLHQPWPLSQYHLWNNSPKNSNKAWCWSSARGDLVPQIARYDQGRVLVLPNSLCSGISSQLCVTDLWALEAFLLSSWLGSFPCMSCQLWVFEYLFKSHVNSNKKSLQLYQENW